MRKNLIKRCMALLMACLMVFAYTLPVNATAQEEKTYTVDYLVLEPISYHDMQTRFLGEDVRADGTVLLERGKTYNFAMEVLSDTTGSGAMEVNFGLGTGGGSGWPFFYSLDANDLYGMGNKESDDGESKSVIRFQNVSLYDAEQIEPKESESYYEYTPSFFLSGDFYIEADRFIHAEYTEHLPSSFQAINYETDYLALDSYTELENEEKAEYTIKYSGSVGSVGTIHDAENQYVGQSLEFYYYTEDEADFAFSGNPYAVYCHDCDASVTYRGQTNYFEKEPGKVSYSFVRPAVEFTLCVKEWAMTEYSYPSAEPEEADTVSANEDYVIDYTEISGQEDAYEKETGPQEVTNSVAVTSIVAGTLGLGGSVAANVISGLQPADLPPSGKKRMFADDVEDVEQEVTTGEPPKLPKEDTPNVSMSIYKPFNALVNTKGAAADLHITMKGGDGLHWNYIPTAICLDGLKAVVPTVVGQGNEATLILALTGAEMKKAHSSVFVTVIAWAYAANGQIVKTTGSTEIPLHAKGLEAKWNEDGTLKVSSYSDSNLDGIAEIKELTADEYTLSEEENGEITVIAKETRLGSVKIACKP